MYFKYIGSSLGQQQQQKQKSQTRPILESLIPSRMLNKKFLEDFFLPLTALISGFHNTVKTFYKYFTIYII